MRLRRVAPILAISASLLVAVTPLQSAAQPVVASTSTVGATVETPTRTIYGITSGGGNLYSFPANDPAGALYVSQVSGLGAGEHLIGIDISPMTNVLYAVSATDASEGSAGTGRLYTIDKVTAAASAVTLATPVPLNGRWFEVEVDPCAESRLGAIRIVSDQGMDVRISLVSGQSSFRPGLAFANSDINSSRSLRLAAAAYGPAGGAAICTTQFFGNDFLADVLVAETAANSARFETLGATTINSSNLAGLDADPDGNLYATTQQIFGPPDDPGYDNGSRFFIANPTSGALAFISTVDSPILNDIAVDQTPTEGGPVEIGDTAREARLHDLIEQAQSLALGAGGSEDHWAGARILRSGGSIRVAVHLTPGGPTTEARVRALSDDITVIPARATWAEMLSIRDYVTENIGSLGNFGNITSSWGPDAGSNTVEVSVSALNPAQIAHFAALGYGPDRVSFQVDAAAGRSAPATRRADGPPFYSGNLVYGPDGPDGGSCTTGPLIANRGTGEQFQLTAAHCFPNNTEVRNGELVVGRVAFRDDRTRNSLDVELIRGGAYQARVWRDPGTIVGPQVGFARAEAEGELVCTSGAFNNGGQEVCSVMIVDVDRCLQYDEEFNLQVCGVNFAQRRGAVVHVPGDSGSSVYSPNASGGLLVRGTLSGGRFGNPCIQGGRRMDVCYNDVVYIRMTHILTFYSAGLVTTR